MAHTKESLSQAINLVWVLPENIVKKHLTKHFLLYWSTSYFKKQLTNNFFIEKDGYTFTVNFNTFNQECFNDPLAQVALSFRLPNPDLDLQPVVLVSCTSPKKKGN